MYNYIGLPDTNRVSRVSTATAVLWLHYMVHIRLFPKINLLCFCINTFRSMCAVPSMAVVCSSLMLCFPGLLLRYFLIDSEILPVADAVTGVVLF